MTSWAAQVAGMSVLSQAQRSALGFTGKSLAAQVAGGSSIMDAYRHTASTGGIMDAYRSGAFEGVVSKSLAAQVAGIAGSSSIMDAYRHTASTGGIMDAYRRTLGIVSKSYAAQMVGTSGIEAFHRGVAETTTHSLLFGERYRASTLGAVSHLVGPGTPTELVDQVVEDETLSGLGSSDAWLLIEEEAPELAAAIDEQAKQLGVPWVDVPAVRNTLAGIVVGLVLSAYLVGLLVPPPLNGILYLILSAGGVSVPGATRRMDRWLDEKSPEAPGDGAQ